MRRVLQFLVVMLLAALLGVTAFAVGFGVNYYLTQTQQVSTQIPSNFGLFWEAWRIIKGEFYGEVPPYQTLTHGAIRGMLQGLGDPHTVLVDPQTAKNEQSRLRGETGDVGLNLDVKNQLMIIVSPVPGSPAERAGLRSGDILLKIDDKNITPDVTVQDAQALLRGNIGSTVTLTIHHIGEPKSETTELLRDKYPLPTIQSRVLPTTTFGYVKVSTVTAETGNELAKALDSLKSQRISGLVLDLRNNPGGLFPDPVLDMAGEFLKNSDVVVYEKYRDGTEKSYRAGSRRSATDIPLVVLVNNGTASDAEILAGALKDYKRAVLIGEPTFGKGSVQVVRQLSDGAAVHITVATWFTPKHTEIEGTGLQPDLSVPFTEDDVKKGQDPQLERAIEYLRKGA